MLASKQNGRKNAPLKTKRGLQRRRPNEASTAERVANQQFSLGDCAGPDGVTKVPCSQSHSYEAYARANLASAGDVYPGFSLMDEQSEEYCRRELANAGLSGNIFAVYPNEWEWEEFGMHAVTCLVSTPVRTAVPIEDLSTATFDDDGGDGEGL